MVGCHDRKLLPNGQSLLLLVGRDRCRSSLCRITMIHQVIANYHARGHCRSTIHLYAQQLRDSSGLQNSGAGASQVWPTGLCRRGDTPGETIPEGLNRDEVIRLLATTEGDRTFDIRARAILMLLITYGLRAGEVSGLQLGDLDWEREMLRVRCPKPWVYGSLTLTHEASGRPSCAICARFVPSNLTERYS